MPSLKDLRNRIDSVKVNQKNYSSNENGCCIKIKKSSKFAEKRRNYSAGIEDIVKNLSFRRLFRTSSNCKR